MSSSSRGCGTCDEVSGKREQGSEGRCGTVGERWNEVSLGLPLPDATAYLPDRSIVAIIVLPFFGWGARCVYIVCFSLSQLSTQHAMTSGCFLFSSDGVAVVAPSPGPCSLADCCCCEFR